MDISGFYESLSALPKSDLNAWQSFFMKFYQAWFSNGRWQQYFKGLVSTIEVTVLALAIGVCLGVIVAIVRTAHAQQRPGTHNPLLAVIDFIFKIYVTVIRGTPMMVQLLIMGFVIFSSSRNTTFVGGS